MTTESRFQKQLIEQIKDLYPGAIVLKTDPSYIQGFPDLLILNERNWAALEVKQSLNSGHQPNQEYWIDYLNKMSYASFVFQENMREVHRGLQETFRSRRPTRISLR